MELKDLEKQSDTIHLAACQRVGETGLLSPCHILVSTTQLVVLNPGPKYFLFVCNSIYLKLFSRPGTCLPSSSRHLSSIVKITSKKRQPEIITFKVEMFEPHHWPGQLIRTLSTIFFLQFGTSQNDEVTVFDMDRFFIPTAGKVTSVVKTQIEKLKE